ncbi:MAG: hypothetical protein K8U03_16070, partial [Planctomycetia bacterium]|nr:hypothetical protein [Planctomycetia bacterium]
IGLVASRGGRLVALSAAPFVAGLARVAVSLRYVGPYTIESTTAPARFAPASLTRVDLDPIYGLASVRRGDLELRLKAAVPVAPRSEDESCGADWLETASSKGT